jgi:hypothetical protein
VRSLLLASLSDDFRTVDWVRFAALGLGSLLFGFSAAVMVEAKKFRMPPAHVWAIAISYMALVLTLMIEVAERWGHALTWRTWVALASFSVGLYSQYLMYRAYHFAARLRRHERKAVQEGNRIMQEVFRRSSSGVEEHHREEDEGR